MMKLAMIALIALFIVLISGCASWKEDAANRQPNNSTAGANSATVYCVEQGGRSIIEETPDGQAGYCSFLDGRFCEEWKFFRSRGSECS